MSWIDYYNLLQKYNGKISLATPKEMRAAAQANPNTPSTAFQIAYNKFHKKESLAAVTAR